MSRWRRAAALLGVVAQSVVVHALGAQTIFLSAGVLAQNDSMSPAPSFSVTAINTLPGVSYRTVLELSTESSFSRPFFTDTAAGVGLSAQLDSLLAQKQRIYLRARLVDQFGSVVATTTANYPVQAWLKLEVPAQMNLVRVMTRTPTFKWSSPAITLLWQYYVTVTKTGTSEFKRMGPTNADSLVFDSLEANSSYHWEVTANARGSTSAATITVASAGSFYIPGATPFTLFYQNFPNPFGRGQRLAETCFWFDLDHDATVQLTIYDLRLHQVRKIIPGALGNGQLSAGAYGREVIDATGCDQRVAWDGRDDRGNFVPPGVYVARLVVDGKSMVIKMLYTGPP
jgi:hypothetical protein